MTNLLYEFSKEQEKWNEILKKLETPTFNTIEDEIHFYKNIYKNYLKNVFYYERLLQFEGRFPLGTEKQKRAYIESWLSNLHFDFNLKIEFYEYARLNLKDRDEIFFRKESKKVEIFAIIDSNLLLEDYLHKRLKQLDPSKIQRIPWLASKVDAVELIYALNSSGVIGKKNLTRLFLNFQLIFDMKIDQNYSAIYAEIKERKEPSKFLNKLVESFEIRIA